MEVDLGEDFLEPPRAAAVEPPRAVEGVPNFLGESDSDEGGDQVVAAVEPPRAVVVANFLGESTDDEGVDQVVVASKPPKAAVIGKKRAISKMPEGWGIEWFL